MAPRAYWKGSLKLSLVTCPVALYPASTAAEKTRFHMINRETGNRLKQQMVDAETGDVVEADQKARGYELSKGNYVEVEKDELEEATSTALNAVELCRSSGSSIAPCFQSRMRLPLSEMKTFPFFSRMRAPFS